MKFSNFFSLYIFFLPHEIICDELFKNLLRLEWCNFGLFNNFLLLLLLLFGFSNIVVCVCFFSFLVCESTFQVSKFERFKFDWLIAIKNEFLGLHWIIHIEFVCIWNILSMRFFHGFFLVRASNNNSSSNKLIMIMSIKLFCSKKKNKNKKK